MARMIYSGIKKKLKGGGGDDAASEAELQTTAYGEGDGGDIEAGGSVNEVVQVRQPDAPAADAGGAGGDIEAGGSVNEAVQVRQSDVPAAGAGTKTIAELAIPAVLSIGIYSSIPPDVQIHHGARARASVRFLYYPLVTSIALAMGSSLCMIFYALKRFDGGGREEEEAAVESAKRRWMRVSIVFLLLAFTLRFFLLL